MCLSVGCDPFTRRSEVTYPTLPGIMLPLRKRILPLISQHKHHQDLHLNMKSPIRYPLEKYAKIGSKLNSPRHLHCKYFFDARKSKRLFVTGKYILFLSLCQHRRHRSNVQYFVVRSFKQVSDVEVNL